MCIYIRVNVCMCVTLSGDMLSVMRTMCLCAEGLENDLFANSSSLACFNPE